MATTDYDAPRTVTTEDSLEQLQARRPALNMTVIDFDDNDLVVTFEAMGIDHFDEELTVPVIPMRLDEFRCGRCFLVHHRNRRVSAGQDFCQDCG